MPENYNFVHFDSILYPFMIIIGYYGTLYAAEYGADRFFIEAVSWTNCVLYVADCAQRFDRGTNLVLYQFLY